MQNGYFQLVNAPGGYGLQIFQPKDGGADVNLQEVLNYLERESVPYDPMAIKKAILSGEDTVCFLERKDCPALEETYSIEVSQDNMQVILRFYPASQSGKRTTMDRIRVIRRFLDIRHNLHFVHSPRSFCLVNVAHTAFVTAFLKKVQNLVSFGRFNEKVSTHL